MATTIPHSASVADTADAVRNALACFGHRVIATWDLEDRDGCPVVWIIPAGCDTGGGQYLRPGQRVVVSGNGSWQIEPVSTPAVAA